MAASTWLLPGRGTSTGREAEVVVVNPGSKAVTVRLESLDAGERAEVAAATISIPAGDRRALDLAGIGGNPALVVDASGPVVVGHSAVVVEGPGVVRALGTPFPDAVVTLPPAR